MNFDYNNYTSQDKLNIVNICSEKGIDLTSVPLETLADLYLSLCDEHYPLSKRNSLLKFLLRVDYDKYKYLCTSERLLTEAATAANTELEKQYSEAYNNGDVEKMQELMEALGPQLGIRQDVWTEVCISNRDRMHNLIETYGLNTNNPFFVFFQEYYKKNTNLEPFYNEVNLNILNDMVYRGFLDVRQLSFRIADEYRVRILINPSLWIHTREQIEYYIKMYQWFLQNDMNKYIQNIYIRAAFKTSEAGHVDNNGVITNRYGADEDRPVEKVDIDMNIAVRRACFYTNYIAAICDIAEKTGKDMKKFYNQAAQLINQLSELRSRSDKFDYSTPIISTADLKQQFGLLKEYTIESFRDTSGRYQKNDVENAKGDDKSNFNNSKTTSKQTYANSYVDRNGQLFYKTFNMTPAQAAKLGIDFAAIAQGLKGE